jgi:Transglycosylase SLT domain
MALAARINDIPLDVLYAVGLTETGARDGFNPYDMDVDGRAIHPNSLDEALAMFHAQMSAGAKFIDIGCMQINYQWHSKEFGSLVDMFDPRQNVRFAARFLKQLRAEESSWTLAVARYNASPNNNVAQKKYVCAVLSNLVASGLGKWTPAAIAFCR